MYGYSEGDVDIRRRRDGSIDTAHYARLGRALHGRAVRNAVGLVFRLALTVSILSLSMGVAIRGVPA